MNSNEINWGNLPTKIIRKVGKNIENGLLINVRQVNKRWYNTLNWLLIYSIDICNSNLAPDLIKNHLYCIKEWPSKFKNESYSLVTDIVKSLESISWNNSNESITTLNNLISKFTAIKTLSIEISDPKYLIQHITDLLKLVKDLKDLETLRFQTYISHLQPLADCVRYVNLKSLCLKGLSNESEYTWKAYRNAPSINLLAWN